MEKTLNLLNRLVTLKIMGKYAIGGAMGAMFYAEPVSTFDLDIFVALPRLSPGFFAWSTWWPLPFKPEGQKTAQE